MAMLRPALALRLTALLAAAVSAAGHADVQLIAIGTIDAHYEDLAFETSPALESGVAGNTLGGMGSGLAYAGGNRFLALPDRGPNATSYDSSVDNTASFIPRVHSVSLSLAPSPAGSALPFVLSAHLQNTTLLASLSPLNYGAQVPALNSSDRRYYFSGRSDNFSASTPSTSNKNARLDPEGIRLSNDGQSFFISDEYGPYVYQFDRRSGLRLRTFNLPEKFAATVLSSIGDDEIAQNSAGRIANKGMEGLAISPDGRTLIGIMQSPLAQDGGTNAAFTRIVTVDIRTGSTREYAYELSNVGTASKPKYLSVSEILAINDHEFLVDERDGKGLGDGSAAAYKRLYKIDLTDATDVSTLTGAGNLAGKAVAKTLFLDLVAAFNATGISSQDIPAKIEGIAFGPDINIQGVTKHTLFVVNDNDFLATITDGAHPLGTDNPNRFYVFAIDTSTLPSFVPQAIRPHSRFQY